MTEPLKQCDKNYRKKPVVVTASQWFKEGDHPKVERPWSSRSDFRCPHCSGAWGKHGAIRTLEDSQHGAHFVCPGDWIICGVVGEYYACKPDVFERTYEPASTTDELAETKHLLATVEARYEKFYEGYTAPSHALQNAAPQEKYEVGFGVGSNLQPPLESDARGESPAVAALPSTTPRRADYRAKYSAFLLEKDQEAAKWEKEGDMYGWNFHMGARSGAVGMNFVSETHIADLERELAEIRGALRHSDAENGELRQENGALSAASAIGRSEFSERLVTALADRFGVARPTLLRWLNGEVEPAPEFQDYVLKAIGGKA